MGRVRSDGTYFNEAMYKPTLETNERGSSNREDNTLPLVVGCLGRRPLLVFFFYLRFFPLLFPSPPRANTRTGESTMVIPPTVMLASGAVARSMLEPKCNPMVIFSSTARESSSAMRESQRRVRIIVQGSLAVGPVNLIFVS
jgi:hypothetical protein